MKRKLDIEYHPGHSLYIGLWNGGAIWMERQDRYVTGWKPELEKVQGEYLAWWGRLHAILTPPGWRSLKVAL